MSSSKPILLILIALSGLLLNSGESAVMQLFNVNGSIYTGDEPFTVDKYCLVFPPSHCIDDASNNLNKSNVELFREQFCPSQRMFICVEEFARRCMPSYKKYHEYLTMVVVKSSKLKDTDLCAKGPYKKENLRYVECIRHASSVYNDVCPVTDEKYLHDLVMSNYTFDKYMFCLQQVVYAFCGPNTQTFLLDYLLAMNSTFGYNQPRPSLKPGLKSFEYAHV